MRKEKLILGQVYHVYSRSIAGFKIFNNEADYFRMLDMIRYYQKDKPDCRFSRYSQLAKVYQDRHIFNKDNLVEIIAYCVMPTHLHLVLKQLKDNGISIFMSNLLNSYTRYFNVKRKRKGPLWEGRFKSIHVAKEEYLLHLTRYIHLNPVVDDLVDNPQQWFASSYREYIDKSDKEFICNFNDLIAIKPKDYCEFTERRILDQKTLDKIKHLVFNE